MKKSSGVRLQELPFFPPLQCCHTGSSVLNFSNLLLSIFSRPLLFHFLPLSLPLFSCSPFLVLMFVLSQTFSSHISFCVSSLSLSLLHIFLSSFPQGLPVWYSTCVAGRQDGLEHGQAPQTTLIYRTAFQSLLQCCSTYINTSTGREPQSKRGKKAKIIERDKNKQERTNVEFYEVALLLCKQGEYART